MRLFRTFFLVSLFIPFAGTVWAGSCSPAAGNARTFGYASSTGVTTSAADVTLTGGSIFALEVQAPSTNTDLIYIAPGTATTSSLPIKPGTDVCVPLMGDSTLSVISASGTQAVQIVLLYR